MNTNELAYRKAQFRHRGLSELDAEIGAYLQLKHDNELLAQAKSRLCRKNALANFREQAPTLAGGTPKLSILCKSGSTFKPLSTR